MFVVKVASDGYPCGTQGAAVDPVEITVNGASVLGLSRKGTDGQHKRGIRIVIINPINEEQIVNEVFDAYKSSDQLD